MTLDQWVSLASAAVSFIGLLFVALQIRHATRQRHFDSLYQVYDVNRQLLSLGLDHPELFTILEGGTISDALLQRRYLQMWLNQLSLVHSYLKRGGFDSEFEESLERDIRYFIMLEPVRKHWGRFCGYYPPSFQERVNAILRKQVEAQHPAHDS